MNGLHEEERNSPFLAFKMSCTKFSQPLNLTFYLFPPLFETTTKHTRKKKEEMGKEGGKCRKQQCFLFFTVAKMRGQSEHNYVHIICVKMEVRLTCIAKLHICKVRLCLSTQGVQIIAEKLTYKWGRCL